MRPVDENDKDPMQEEQPVDSGETGSDPPPASAETESATQADIDALLAGVESGGEADGDVPQATAQEDGSEATGQQDTQADPPPASTDTQEISQGDVDALLAGGASAGAVPQATVPEDGPQATGQPDTRVDTLGRPFDEAAAAMQAAMQEDQDVQRGGAPPLDAKPFELSDLSDSALGDIDAKRVSMLNDVNLRVKIQLGQTRMLVEDVLKLNKGSVVELDKLAGDPVDVYVNDRLIARGEVLVLNDTFCVRVSEVLSHDPHRVSAK